MKRLNDIVAGLSENENRLKEKLATDVKQTQDMASASPSKQLKSSQKRNIQSSSSAALKRKKKHPEGEWGVEKLLGHEMRAGKRYYQVRWEGFVSDEDTWEPEHNLNCIEILSAYKEKNNLN